MNRPSDLPRGPAPIWLFDLDNTLHDAGAHIFPQINQAMTDYVAQHLALEAAEANRLRMDYWRRYGATLTGLMRHHGIDPHHFLWHTHQFPHLPRQLVVERGMAALLRRLPGRKILFSNAPIHYAQQVLQHLGIADVFDSVWCLERLHFTPKPFPAAFRRLLAQEKLRPERCIMVEDSMDNLRTAKRLGMKTVLITSSNRSAPWVDVRLKTIRDLRHRASGCAHPTERAPTPDKAMFRCPESRLLQRGY